MARDQVGDRGSAVVERVLVNGGQVVGPREQGRGVHVVDHDDLEHGVAHARIAVGHGEFRRPLGGGRGGRHVLVGDVAQEGLHGNDARVGVEGDGERDRPVGTAGVGPDGGASVGDGIAADADLARRGALVPDGQAVIQRTGCLEADAQHPLVEIGRIGVDERGGVVEDGRRIQFRVVDGAGGQGDDGVGVGDGDDLLDDGEITHLLLVVVEADLAPVKQHDGVGSRGARAHGGVGDGEVEDLVLIDQNAVVAHRIVAVGQGGHHRSRGYHGAVEVQIFIDHHDANEVVVVHPDVDAADEGGHRPGGGARPHVVRGEVIDAVLLIDAGLGEQEGARRERDVTDEHVLLHQGNARGPVGARLVEEMGKGAAGIVVRGVGVEHDDVPRADGQAVAAGHDLVVFRDKQQVAPLQVDAVGAADGHAVAHDVQAVDGHVLAGRQGLQIHVVEHAAVRPCRLEQQVRLRNGEHVACVPGRDARDLAVVHVRLRGEQDPDLAG